jgi:hypothetical protein
MSHIPAYCSQAVIRDNYLYILSIFIKGMSLRVTFLEVRRLGREADNLPPTSAEIKKAWI